MNKGIQASNGEYLLFLNSGDWLFGKDVLQVVSSNFLRLDILYGNMVKVFPDGRRLMDKGSKSQILSLNFFIKNSLNHPSTFIKRRLFLNH